MKPSLLSHGDCTITLPTFSSSSPEFAVMNYVFLLLVLFWDYEVCEVTYNRMTEWYNNMNKKHFERNYLGLTKVFSVISWKYLGHDKRCFKWHRTKHISKRIKTLLLHQPVRSHHAPTLIFILQSCHWSEEFRCSYNRKNPIKTVSLGFTAVSATATGSFWGWYCAADMNLISFTISVSL
jgi:hypothetical protein